MRHLSRAPRPPRPGDRPAGPQPSPCASPWRRALLAALSLGAASACASTPTPPWALMTPDELAARLRAIEPAGLALGCFVEAPEGCVLTLDVDADKTPDRVVAVVDLRRCGGEGPDGRSCRSGLVIFLSSGSVEVFGAAIPRPITWVDFELIDNTRSVSFQAGVLKEDFASLVSFEALARADGAGDTVGISRSVKRRPVPMDGALGDGLLLDFGDVTYVLYLGPEGWRMMDLGY